MAHTLVAHQGRPRDALVEPSTGSTTTHIGRGFCAARLLGEGPEPACSMTAKAASSATRSLRYWPARVPARPSRQALEAVGHGGHHSWRTSSTSSTET